MGDLNSHLLILLVPKRVSWSAYPLPNNITNYSVDDDSGDDKNAKISAQLLPDRDYYVQMQTFDPKGGKFEFSITSW